MVRGSVLQYKASLQGDYQQILQASGEDIPVKNKHRQEVLIGARVSVYIIVITGIVTATGLGFLIMIL